MEYYQQHKIPNKSRSTTLTAFSVLYILYRYVVKIETCSRMPRIYQGKGCSKYLCFFCAAIPFAIVEGCCQGMMKSKKM
jgi:hypothetical protein